MDFLFVYGEIDESTRISIKKQATITWGQVGEIRINRLSLIFPLSQSSVYLIETPEYLGCLDGWGTLIQSKHEQDLRIGFFDSLRKNWPILDTDVSGCFSGILYDRENQSLKIYSDLSGIYPLYYTNHQRGWIGGTSLVALGSFLRPDIDLIGIIERLSPPDYINFGSRTILKGINKLLPGELIKFTAGQQSISIFDATLFGQISHQSVQDDACSLWEVIKSDVLSCISQFDKINLGMSGGWDSRIIAGALKFSNKNKTFLTWGTSEDAYEVKIAKSCADMVNADFRYCDMYPSYFPTYDAFSRNILNGEGTLITPWFSVNNANKSITRECILLGDMFEVVVGRNIKSFTSRKKRRAYFINPRAKKNSLLAATRSNFTAWENKKISEITGSQLKQLSLINRDLVGSYTKKQIAEEISSDLQQLFSRIEVNDVPFQCLYDELFRWYTHGLSMGYQFLALKEKYTPLAPTMGFRTIRAASRIDPMARADGRLLHEIQKHSDFTSLSALPSATIPFFPSSYPLWFKNIVWGARFISDQWLIRWALLTKNKNSKLRVLKTFSWVSLYNHPEALERVDSWFSNHLIKDKQKYLDLVVKRAELSLWPMPNNDIVGPANTCIMYDLINN